MTIQDLEHPLRELILELSADGAAPLSSLSVEGARERFADFVPMEPTVGDVELIRDYQIAGDGQPIDLRIYRPHSNDTLPVLVWLHGGSWILGNLDIYDNLCRALAEKTEHIVVSVDYRLAPEHKFPAGLNDCYAAIKWVADNIELAEGDPDEISVGGDSAGANLAAALTLLVRDEGGPDINHQVLVYPATRFPYPAESQLKRGYFLSKQDVDWSWSLYVRDRIDGYNKYASPLNARNLSELPPATVITCRFDPLRLDGEYYAERLQAAEVPTQHVHYENVVHGFITLLAEPRVETAWNALEVIDTQLPRSE